MKLFNFHTHNKSEEYGIINISPGEDIIEGKIYSCGLHPWYIDSDYQEKTENIRQLAGENKIVAIGEAGFDPKSPADLNLQKDVFRKHVGISEKYNKVLIIHCVKYYNELIALKKEIKPAGAWIIHGFRGKIQTASELLKHGFYFSVSESLFIDRHKAEQFFKLIPFDKIFFETDDSNYLIENIYNFASIQYKISLEELVLQINRNLESIGIWVG